MAANFGQFPVNFWFSGALVVVEVVVAVVVVVVVVVEVVVVGCTIHCSQFIVHYLVFLI